MKRVRFAPSPTGSLHVGNALSAVANRRLGDWMLLRIDDTDRARNVEGGEEAILQDLEWLGVAWDEGPVRQSERAGRLPRRRRAARRRPVRRHHAAARGRHGDLPPRQRRRRRRLRHHARRPRLDHRPNEELHRALHEALGTPPPECVHHGLVLGADGSKLSKRDDFSSVAELREAGIPPEAVRAYLEELGVPKHDVRSTCRGSAGSRSRRSAGSPTRSSPSEWACRSPPCPVAPRRARPERGARVRRRGADRAEPGRTSDARDARAVSRAARRRTSAERRALVRELKAVGGDLQALRLALTGARARPRARGGPRGVAARRGAARRRLVRCGSTSTLARELVELPPPPGPVRMYFCGPTVYARAHVGNARPFVVGDVAARVAARARLRGGARPQHHRRQRQDLRGGAGRERRARRARRPRGTSRTRATSGSACPITCRGRPSRFPRSSRSSSSSSRAASPMRSTATSTSASRATPITGGSPASAPIRSRSRSRTRCKEDPRDFALWKANKPGEDTWWDSPWGRGRPGWHIECSAMAEELLGPAFEIHGGGLDLVFPHHENELAQSRALGHEFAQIWMHNGMLRFAGEKMSKSLGNVATLRDALDEWGRETLLLFFLTAPLAQADRLLRRDARRRRARRSRRFRNAFRGEPARRRTATGSGSRRCSTTTSTRRTRWRSSTSGARRAARLLARARRLRARLARRAGGRAVRGDELAERRQQARAERDFAEADRLRDELDAAGWEVRDEPAAATSSCRRR